MSLLTNVWASDRYFSAVASTFQMSLRGLGRMAFGLASGWSTAGSLD